MSNWIDYSWVGSQKHFVDKIDTQCLGNVLLGRFGGNSTANRKVKNEDGCLVWANADLNVEFAVLLDAHKSAESAELVVATIESLQTDIKQILALPTRETFRKLENLLLTTFESQSFRSACQEVEGETACLIVARKDKYLWWFSVGDCILHLHHPELVALNEYQQNHRSFYEWIGKVNTFDLEVPCFSTGIKELRKGQNHIFLTTDGLVECPNVSFDNPQEIFRAFQRATNEEGVFYLLDEIQNNGVLDSTTILSWFVEIEDEGMQPSDRVK
ncbi:protein phosphatase 2C domain-containing protein [Ureibacillus acetophenoni]|uniref:Serine/threonine protein phosphatase PrpC n=1 Tax=Ureibacillus acetophenoni TaxID=614649 RepID=A0A285UDI5_9BACL|nr:protein phosphatase 2C domain-containing protein [Ureibacillus acetophenoni]SOC39940.1 serine/threonine protein phosphatase PrpC [Ureibacillus acetophenoni]